MWRRYCLEAEKLVKLRKQMKVDDYAFIEQGEGINKDSIDVDGCGGIMNVLVKIGSRPTRGLYVRRLFLVSLI